MSFETERKLSDLIEEAEDLILSGKYPEALAKYDEAISSDPKDPLAFVGKASVLKVTGKFNECVSCMDSALSLLPEWKIAEEDTEQFNAFTSMLLVLKAEALLHAKKADMALQSLDKADDIHGTDAASLLVRGHAYAQKKNYAEAGNCFYRAEEWCFLHEDSMLSQIWLSKIELVKEAGKPFAPPYAATLYQTGNWRKPVGSAEELFERGNNLRSEGLVYDALRYYDACLEKEQENKALVLFFKGIIFEQLKMFNEAFSLYADALKADPMPEDEFKIRVRWANAKSLRT